MGSDGLSGCLHYRPIWRWIDLSAYHNLMPINKWVARSAGCGRGEAAGGETRTAHHARIQNPSHQRFCKRGGSLALRMENIYIKKSMASFKS